MSSKKMKSEISYTAKFMFLLKKNKKDALFISIFNFLTHMSDAQVSCAFLL